MCNYRWWELQSCVTIDGGELQSCVTIDGGSYSHV